MMIKQPYYQMLINTPLGIMRAIADDTYLIRLDFTQTLQSNSLENSVFLSQPLLQVQEELKQYFDGQLEIFKTPIKLIGTPFQLQVWHFLKTIPFGTTVSYKSEAEQLNKPTAYRAVANANASNPLSIIIPCHRVINHNGKLGGYSGGLDKKRWLLKFERVELSF